MCAIRLIRRTLSSEINDQIIELNGININPIDRPAYVVYACREDKYGMEFIFTSDKEERTKYQINGIVVEYGVNSGRIYKLLANKNEINQTDSFHFITDSTTESSTERFKENIKGFIAICNRIIQFSINNPV